MTNQQSLLQKVRVRNLPHGWKIKTVGEACMIRNDLRKPIALDERDNIQGMYPYYGPTGILSYINNYLVEGCFALIGEDGDHFLKYASKDQTLLVKGKFNVNNHAHIIGATKECSAAWFYHFFRHRNITSFLSRQGAGRYKLNKDTLRRLPIILPPSTEQIAIADMFSIWDQAIETTKQLIAAKERKYTWLLGNFISNHKYHRDYIRNFAIEISRRNNGITINRVLSVTNNRGFILPADHFERSVASSDLSNYKIVTRGQYAYNPSRINVGSIERLDTWDAGVLSPMYVVFELNEQKVNTDYFLHWLESHEAKQRIRKSAQGSVRETVSFSDFAAISIALPSLNKQKTIAAILNTARQEIDLLKKQLEAYRRQKRGLMQKLLTGQWRVKMPDND